MIDPKWYEVVIPAVVFSIFWAICGALLYSVNRIGNPPTSNRIPRIKIFLTVLWVISALSFVAIGMMIKSKYDNLGRPIPFDKLREDKVYVVIMPVNYDMSLTLIGIADKKDPTNSACIQHPLGMSFKTGDRFLIKGGRVFSQIPPYTYSVPVL